MSSETPKNEQPELDPVDAVVLAGSKGAPLFRTPSGAEIAKPYLEVGGQALVVRVVKAVLAAEGIGRVYVVGDPVSLAQVLDPLGVDSARLRLVPEGGSLLENSLLAYFRHLLPDRGFADAADLDLDAKSLGEFRDRHPEATAIAALAITSDLPFVAAQDVEEFLRAAPAGAAIVAGLGDHADLVKMQQALGRQTVLDRWKLGAIPLRSCEVRWNNLFLCRPLLADPVLYSLLGDLYTHRWLLDQDGGVLWHNWWANLRSLARYSVRIRGRFRFFRGLLNSLAYMLATAMARLTRKAGRWLAWPFRLFLGRQDLETIASQLIGARARVVIARNVAPAIDIDVEESHRALVADGGENYRRVARYLGRLNEAGGPGDGVDPKGNTGGNS